MDTQTETDEELIEQAIGLHTAIYNFDCYSNHEVYEFDRITAELRKRGFQVDVTETLSIEKSE